MSQNNAADEREGFVAVKRPDLERIVVLLSRLENEGEGLMG